MLPELPLEARKIAYLGTPDIAVTPLKSLHQLGLDIAIVVTGKDKRRGRGGQTTPSPVKIESERLGLPVTHDLSSLSGLNVDLGVVVAYGHIIPESTLKQVPMVNLHFSLLPKWRGAAPVERAILAGDPFTGVCVMEVGKDLDTGGIYRKETVPLNTNKSLSAIRNDLCKKGTELLIDCFKSGFGIPLPQSGEASYANKVKPDEHRIIWSQGAEEIHRIIRLENAWTTLNGKRLQILEAKIEMAGRQEPGEIKGTLVGAGKGNLDLITVKPEGRKKISAKDWINGIRVTDDTRLGE